MRNLSLSLLMILTGCLAVTENAGAQSFDWARGMGGKSADYSNGMAVDGSGNVYVTGYYNSATAEFNPGGTGGTLTNAGYANVFLAKYDAGGNYLWARSMGGSNDDEAFAVAADASGNVYVVGIFTSDTADFNPGGSGGKLTNKGFINAFLAKYDTAGNYLWAKSIGGNNDDEAYAVAADASGNVYVTGIFGSDTTDFNPGGSGGKLVPAGDADVFLAKYDAGGSYLWAKGMGGISADYGYGVVVDGSDNVYVTGMFNSATAEFNPGGSGGTLTPAGKHDVFLAKYDAAGAYIWAKSMGGSNDDYARGVALDDSANVYVMGYFNSATAEFNAGGSGGTLSTAGNYDVFLAKYDTRGNYRWAKSMGGNVSDQGRGLAVDGSGNVYVTGLFNSAAAEFNPGGTGGTLTPAAAADAFLAKYDAGGSYLWAKSMGGGSSDQGLGVAVDGSGNVYGTGWFGPATAEFNAGNGDTLRSAGGSDAFVVKFACSDTSSSYITVSLLCGESYTLGDSTYTATGIYTQIVPNAAGCDSTVTLDLTITPISKPAINVNNFTLSVAGTYATYQWIRNDTLIPGATGSSYTVVTNAAYRVAVTNGKGCSDTSNVYDVNNVSIGSIPGIRLNIYPNPARDIVYIQSPVQINMTLTDLQGRAVKEVKNVQHISLEDLAKGMYLMRITNSDGLLIRTEKLIKAE